MSMRQNLTIEQGETFKYVLRWEVLPIIYIPISAIAQTAPVAITTASAHGLVDGWRAAVLTPIGMTQLAANEPVRSSDYHSVSVVDTTHVSFNDVNASDYDAYVSGGYLQYYTPQSLAGYSARMSIKDYIGGTVLLSLTDVNGGILLDNVLKTITLTSPSTATTALTWQRGVYDLELQDATGVVTRLLYGAVTVSDGVTL